MSIQWFPGHMTSARKKAAETMALTAASVVGLAEFGDLTQLATAGIATRYSAPIAVALGAWCALATVAALAVTAGHWIVQHVPLKIVQRIAGVAFVGFGVATPEDARLVGGFADAVVVGSALVREIEHAVAAGRDPAAAVGERVAGLKAALRLLSSVG